MAFASLNQCLIALVAVLACTVGITQAARRRGQRPKDKTAQFESIGCRRETTVDKNITALWNKVNMLSQPIEVHVHEDNQKCDDYFGCNFMGHKHGKHDDHKNGSHASHGSHKHGSHKHGSHAAHGSHKHGSHGSHGSHASHGGHGGHHGGHHNDNHIHIHLSVNNKDDCGHVSYAPKDQFVYARCDMMPHKKKKGIDGSIYMRQKPHGILETKVLLKGFKAPSEGIKDGKHDFFFDVHQMADFTDGCTSFGVHDHVHHTDGQFDHEHDHSHADDHKGHNHDHQDGHDHTLHDHHAHEEDWGNVIVGQNGQTDMNVNCTHHELYGPESMFGRGIVLHNKKDVVVSCCAITYANLDDEAWGKL